MENAIPPWAQDDVASSPQDSAPAWAQKSVAPPASGEKKQSEFWHDISKEEPGYEYDRYGAFGLIPAKYNTKTGEPELSMPPAVRSVARGIGDLYQSAENKSTEETPESIEAMLALSGAPAMAMGAAEAVPALVRSAKERTPMDLLRTESSVPNKIAPRPKAALAPEDLSTVAHGAISDSYGKALQNSTKYYNFMQSLGEGKAIDSTNLKSGIDGIISDIRADPFHEGRMALPKLQSIADRIGDDGQIPVNDVVDLKKMLNTQFNPKRFMEAKDSPYANLANTTNNTLDAAAKLYPDFGEAKQIADRNWVNNVSMPFRENDVLHRFWKPEDYHAAKSMENGIAEDLPDITKERSMEMLNGISNPTELDAVSRALTSDLAPKFREAVLNNATKGTGTSRLINAGKAAVYGVQGRIPTAIKHAASAFKTYDPEELALINAAKKPGPSLSGKYDDQFSNLKSSLEDDEYEAAMSRLRDVSGAPKEPLALPAPERPMVGGRSSQPRPATDEEWQNLIDQEKSAKESGLTSDVQKAQQKAKISQYERENPANQAFNRLRENKAPISPSRTALHEPTSNLQRSTFPDDEAQAAIDRLEEIGKKNEGFKSGGAVGPSEAQKHAGNYEKDHIKVHGLNISIENPKGSMRSGKDKNGKEWSVQMPVDYGYFKRSEGADGDHVDCFIGPNKHSLRVYIIDQKHHETGKFDEHKVMLSFPDRQSAVEAYKKSFSDGNGAKRIAHVKKMLMPEFKEWLKNGNTKKPIEKAA